MSQHLSWGLIITSTQAPVGKIKIIQEMFNLLVYPTQFINCRGPNFKWLKRKRALAYIFLLMLPKLVYTQDLPVTFPCACESGHIQEYARRGSDEMNAQECYTQVKAKMKEMSVFFLKTSLQLLPLDSVLCSSSSFCCACTCSCLNSIVILCWMGHLSWEAGDLGGCPCPSEYSVF